MAAAPAEDTAEGRAAAMALLDPDLQGILQRADTSAVLQSRMAIARIRSINKLSAMADTRDQARNFCSKDENGQVVAQPSWDILLSYEYQVRKKMVKQMNDGVNMVAALDAAVKDINIKENYFLTPASFAAMSSPHHAEDRSRSPKSWNYKGWDKQGSWGWDKKGSRKGSGKGKRKRAARSIHTHQMGERSASSGTIPELDAGFNVQESTAVRSASVRIQLTAAKDPARTQLEALRLQHREEVTGQPAGRAPSPVENKVLERIGLHLWQLV